MILCYTTPAQAASPFAPAEITVTEGESQILMPSTRFPDGGYIANDDRDDETGNDTARVYIEQGRLGLRFGDYAYIKLVR